MKGFINVIKPSGVSSAYCVAQVKKKTGQPCGHMGTLDPMASGILPVGVGKTSRLFRYMLNKEKTYVAEFKFGISTDTLDTTGEITLSGGKIPTENQINAVINEFVGEINQVPPKYSAKCVDGKRGYALARAGVDFTLEPKKVKIIEFSLIGMTGEDTYKFKIRCGGGTYIRSLAKDLGERLDTCAVMSALDRTECGIFNYENGICLSEIKSLYIEELKARSVPADESVNFEKLYLDEYRSTRILNGVFDNYGYKDGVYRVYACGDFWGIGRAESGVLKMEAYVKD